MTKEPKLAKPQTSRAYAKDPYGDDPVAKAFPKSKLETSHNTYAKSKRKKK